MEMFIQDKNGCLMRVQDNRARLETSPVLRRWIHAPKNPEEDTLEIPFTLLELELALNGNTYYFECWDNIVACASYLDVKISKDAIRVAQMFTIECIRASGINPAHFHEAAMFSQVLAGKDNRFHPVDVRTLETLYWNLVTSKVDLEYVFQNEMGTDVYEAAVKDTRAVRDDLENAPMTTRMTSVM